MELDGKTALVTGHRSIAQARAEERRAKAVALQHEMKSLTQENRAKVVLAEAEIPKGQADAFCNGNLGDRKRRMALPKDSDDILPAVRIFQKTALDLDMERIAE